ncbi:hypothetical protein BS78_05G122500 [Paspalum vaginatum]|nr:hypothetical protein BS78_05G122500 [Paspalum vaginatum]
MADLAVSLAKTVVQGALTKALSAIEEEATLRASTQNDLVFITGEFQMMQSFLNVADEERVSNNVVSTWVRQVRDLAYNVEDCIEYVIHLDKKSDWCCRCLILCLPVPRSMKPQLPLDKAVAEIKQLKARVEDVSHRNMRYNLISDSGSKPATQQQLVPGASVESATFDMQFQARDTKTLQGGFGDLTKLLTTKKPGDDLGVISVWAAGGNPDTTPIIREAYADREICANFGCRGWAKLTHPFNPHEFRRSLLIQFHTNSFKQIEPSGGVSILQRLETAAQGELVQDFIKKMEEERYLVVLENISSMVDWDTVRAYLPEGKKGSWIVVTTQQAEVARLCVGDPWQALELKQHSAEHSAFVFVREVSQGGAGDKSKQTNGIVPNNITPPVGEVQHKGYAFYANIPTSKKNADMWMDRFPLVGVRKSQMSNLRCYLATARVHGFPVISVWGIAGVGKSALVRNLYYTIIRDTNNNTFTKFSWVDILHPFNLRNFAWSLLSEFESDSRQQNGISNPIEGCRKLLDENRCLAVVDGLQTKEEWDLI